MDLQARHIHFVGIGGAGLSAIARVLVERGARVSGSDLQLSAAAEALRGDGVQVYVGHRAEQVAGADSVVVSSAVPDDNVEVRAAREAGIPVLGRSQILNDLGKGRSCVAVAGTHGKTTTTAMISTILWEGGLDPTFIIGGRAVGLGTNARSGTGPHFVVEADEYDHMFLGLQPDVAVVTNVEHDHPDCYPTFEDFRSAFAQFVSLVPNDGLLVVCQEDSAARALGKEREEQGAAVVFYGLEEGATWSARELHPDPSGGTHFLATRQEQVLGEVRLRVPGPHNVLNALAALAVVAHLGVPFPTARSALGSFRGVGRRFEIKGEADGVKVVDDYAHHPTEIRATLAAARERFPGQRLWAVWQPHTYSRTKELLSEFGLAFDAAEHVLVLPIFAARELDTLGVTGDLVAGAMHHTDVRYVESLDDAVVILATEVQPGEVVLTLGAGDGDLVGERLLVALGGEEEDEQGSLDGW